MKLTKKQAIDRTIELWEWLAESGRVKNGWGGWEKYGENNWDCFLCEYDNKKRTNACNSCPYYILFGSCGKTGNPYKNWRIASTTSQRKEYAKLFLNLMYEVRDANKD